ncbi:MAG: hypothetical protein HGA44_00325 [Cellulomonadaceae bacterium]|nr:hypothetical protein [Cellulomonadaceae bacterium]
MSSLRDLDEVAATLLSSVGQAVFGPLSTRVLLRTGVNLRSPRPDQKADPTAVAKVVATLGDMGYRL